MPASLIPSALAAPFLVLLCPAVGLAMDLRWETQGSYVHQLAHLMFAVALMIFLHEIKGKETMAAAGFRNLFWACIFMIWWNLDAVVGHALDWSFTHPVILGGGLNRRLLLDSWHAWAYYVTQITHYLLVIPAFYFFYRSLRAFRREPGGEKS